MKLQIRAEVEEEKKVAEWYLLNESEVRKSLQREAPTCISSPQIDGMPHGKGKTSNPVESIALREISLDERSEIDNKWLAIIDEYLHNTSAKNLQIVKSRREAQSNYRHLTPRERGKGRPSWIEYASGKYADNLYKQTGIKIELPSPKTMILWWESIVLDVYVMALKRKMFE